MISDEAKQLNLEEGDKVIMSLSYPDIPQNRTFSGISVLRLLLDGHILKSVDGSMYVMFDPKGLKKNEPCINSSDIYIAYSDPIDDMPKLTWTNWCNDALYLATSIAWTVESTALASEINRNSRAYLALIQDAWKILLDIDDIDEEITEDSVSEMMRKLRNAGWIYDAVNDKGSYDASKLFEK